MTSADKTDVELPVQHQLDAYNARDIDGFMQWWAEDCEYYEFPARLLARGAAAIRARHLARFEEQNLCGTLRSRISVGNVVVDHETVVRMFPDGPGEIDVIAIYEVDGGRIAKAWFKQGAPRLHLPGTISMRTAGIRDADAVRTLTRNAYAKWISVLGREPMPMQADYERAVHEHRIDMLYLDGGLVALLEMAPEPDHLLVVNIAVAPSFQGRGFGRRLLAHAEHVAATLGLSELRLFTSGFLTANIELYKRTGYVIDREEPFLGGTAVYMSKRI